MLHRMGAYRELTFVHLRHPRDAERWLANLR